MTLPSYPRILLSRHCTTVISSGLSQQAGVRRDGNSEAAEYKVWTCAARAVLVVKKVGGMPPEALGPWKYTLLDGQAALALESTDVNDMCTEGGKELVFRELDQRFPDKVAADRMGEAMEEALGVKIMKSETTEAFTGRSRLAEPTRLESARSRDRRPERRPDAPGEPESHPDAFHDSSCPLRGWSSQPDQRGGSGGFAGRQP